MKKLITLLFSAVLLLSTPVMAAEVDQSRIVNIDASKSIIALGSINIDDPALVDFCCHHRRRKQ